MSRGARAFYLPTYSRCLLNTLPSRQGKAKVDNGCMFKEPNTMKTIPLTQGQVALVDDEDYKFINRWKWRATYCKCTKSFYAVRLTGTRPRKTIYMARLIMNTQPGMDTDHIHHNTLDNRKKELRNVTRTQNIMNQGPRRNNKLGIKGICMDHGKFRVTITKNHKWTFLGRFTKLEDALSAYQTAANEIQGEYQFMPFAYG
jgi:hypothetical protein